MEEAVLEPSKTGHHRYLHTVQKLCYTIVYIYAYI